MTLLREDERPLKCDRCDGTGAYRYDDGQGAGYTEPCQSYYWPAYGFMAHRLAAARGRIEALIALPIQHERMPGAAPGTCYDTCVACQRDAILEGESDG